MLRAQTSIRAAVVKVWERRMIIPCSSQGSYFMVQDVFSKVDVLSTAGSYGAPNFRQSRGGFPLYGMGQPSLSGFKQVLQRLQGQGHQVSVQISSRSPFTFCSEKAMCK